MSLMAVNCDAAVGKDVAQELMIARTSDVVSEAGTVASLVGLKRSG